MTRNACSISPPAYAPSFGLVGLETPWATHHLSYVPLARRYTQVWDVAKLDRYLSRADKSKATKSSLDLEDLTRNGKSKPTRELGAYPGRHSIMSLYISRILTTSNRLSNQNLQLALLFPPFSGRHLMKTLLISRNPPPFFTRDGQPFKLTCYLEEVKHFANG